jgi:hypothetical protein
MVDFRGLVPIIRINEEIKLYQVCKFGEIWLKANPHKVRVMSTVNRKDILNYLGESIAPVLTNYRLTLK